MLLSTPPDMATAMRCFGASVIIDAEPDPGPDLVRRVLTVKVSPAKTSRQKWTHLNRGSIDLFTASGRASIMRAFRPIQNKEHVAFRRCLGLALLASCLFLSAGCFEFEQRITLAPGGDLKFSLHYRFEDEYMPAIRQFHAQIAAWQGADVTADWVFDSEALGERFPTNVFAIREYKAFRRDGFHHIEVTGTAEDGAAALAGGRLGRFQLTRSDDGAVELALELPVATRVAPVDGDDAKALTEAAKGFQARLVVETPAKIKDTNGRKRGDRTAVWQFDSEVLRDPARIPRKLWVKW